MCELLDPIWSESFLEVRELVRGGAMKKEKWWVIELERDAF